MIAYDVSTVAAGEADRLRFRGESVRPRVPPDPAVGGVAQLFPLEPPSHLRIGESEPLARRPHDPLPRLPAVRGGEHLRVDTAEDADKAGALVSEEDVQRLGGLDIPGPEPELPGRAAVFGLSQDGRTTASHSGAVEKANQIADLRRREMDPLDAAGNASIDAVDHDSNPALRHHLPGLAPVFGKEHLGRSGLVDR